MEVVPAVDIRGGKCVRLYQGDYAQETVYGSDPAAMALRWAQAGARLIHVVDLDGARQGRPVNREAIRSIAQSLAVPFQIGGGIRTITAVADYLDLGAARVILGTAAIEDPNLLARACKEFPGRVVLGLDAKEGQVAVAGWQETLDQQAVDLAGKLPADGLAAIIYTDISRDGTHQGLNLEATRAVCQAAPVPVIAAGGVSSLADVEVALTLAADGLWGVITGRALYDHTLDLSQALDLARRSEED
ncbi:MAG: 1-(5-phosphoribosyl)-5-[(5-phosphoribosylamino)methylideneamino]imidazole-4-carboxamide isomerase [Deltaproteobacteria bacterium]|nr:1-(5-phosphoribosyl)-5-[(5-phosphoribosylamino)methylideneamino]imidazole-4-carboxamide isomerase [Deltaproteobacteria bacterium]